MPADVETAIIGAGVVGLASGAALARQGHEVMALERDSHIGQGISSRNSEVIHAGIYYPPGSLKAQLCVRGRHLLYDYCEQRNIPHQRIGKLIVATHDDEIETLELLKLKARQNGVENLCSMSTTEATSLQPGLRCVAALHSPATGIVDSHALMLSLQAEIEAHHGNVVCHTEAVSIQQTNDVFTITLSGGDSFTAKNIINSCGLNSIALAGRTPAIKKESVPQALYAKGNYFRLEGAAPFSKLIYPAPVSGGLGIHLTIDLAGQKRFGPDVEWLTESSADNFDYQVEPQRADSFYAAIRRYWPDLPDNSLVPDYAGVRPKITWPNSEKQDFVISTEKQHGLSGLVNLFGIESPGLTASLAIAEQITNTL